MELRRQDTQHTKTTTTKNNNAISLGGYEKIGCRSTNEPQASHVLDTPNDEASLLEVRQQSLQEISIATLTPLFSSTLKPRKRSSLNRPQNETRHPRCNRVDVDVSVCVCVFCFSLSDTKANTGRNQPVCRDRVLFFHGERDPTRYTLSSYHTIIGSTQVLHHQTEKNYKQYMCPS